MAALPLHDFRISREEDWKELGLLLDRFEANRGKPKSAQEAERLGELYRRTVSSLSVIRSRPEEKRLEGSLNRLVVRAHNQIYRPLPSRVGVRTLRYFQSAFPMAVRMHLPEITTSALIFFAGLGLGYGAVAIDSDAYYALVPLEDARSPGASMESLRDSLQAGREASAGERAQFSGMLWQHNSRVALLSFALGPLAGIPTFLFILFNGLMLGAMSKVFVDADLSAEWFAWLFGHGVTEIGALIIAAAGGLVLGRAVISPGPLTRAGALVEAGHRALGLALGTVLMLFFAALLEGFFRQTDATTSTRYLVGAGTGLLWALYFAFAPKPQTAPDPFSRR